MFGRKKKRKELLPWYRARNYKENLTENEKRELDSFRHRESEGGEHRPMDS
jgi:exonuclease I